MYVVCAKGHFSHHHNHHHHHGLILKVKLVLPFSYYTVSNIMTRSGKYTGRNVEGTVVS
jgi:hypothetical protein